MTELLIRNARIVTMNDKREVLEEAAMAVADGRIVELGDSKELEARYKDAARILDAAGKVVFPGFINNHNHLFQTLIKGLGDDMVIGDWLKKVAYPFAAKITREDVYHGAMIGLMESIHSGVTTTLDYMYAHPVPEISDGVIQAMEELKVRGIYARGFVSEGEEYGTQRAMMETPEEVIADFKRLVETYEKPSKGMLKIWMAPSSPWANTREMLLETWAVAKEYGAGYTVHVSETDTPRNRAKEVHGTIDTLLLEELGIVGPEVLLVHCVAIADRDIEMIRKYDMKVSHNPVCNMYLASGVAPVPQMLEAGITVGLGLDGAASNNSQDMVETLKTAALLHKVHTRNPKIITARKVLEMATIDGARSIGMEKEIGSLEAGKKADFFLFDPSRTAKSTPMHDPISTLVYSSSASNIETVVINGEVVLEEGRILGMDEAAYYRRIQEYALKRAAEVYGR